VLEHEAKLVVDASIVIKWFVKEENRDRALMLREAHLSAGMLLGAPDLVVYEVCNALRYSPEFTETDVEAAVGSLFELHLGLSPPTTETMAGAAEAAFKYGVTVYDAAYLSQAEIEDNRLVTADEKFYEKVKENPRVALLSSDRFLEFIG
jgi:predicted nucleic acid-binding protein